MPNRVSPLVSRATVPSLFTGVEITLHESLRAYGAAICFTFVARPDVVARCFVNLCERSFRSIDRFIESSYPFRRNERENAVSVSIVASVFAVAAQRRIKITASKSSTRRIASFLTILSFAFPGKPEPMVRWLVNGQVKDEEYEKNAGDVIENRYADALFPSSYRHKRSS